MLQKITFEEKLKLSGLKKKITFGEKLKLSSSKK